MSSLFENVVTVKEIFMNLKIILIKLNATVLSFIVLIEKVPGIFTFATLI